MRAFLGVVVGLVLASAGVLLFIWFLWWLWNQSEEEKKLSAIEIDLEATEETPAMAKEAPAAVEEAPAVAKVDDLKRIEGIGPKISSVLQAGGITTFAQLAAADAGQIEHILEEADPRLLRLARPDTWSEQAALAAAGEWEALEALQGELKGGRRA
jgi:predicted flap endonuclease-1-like 5' DNA nuclease